MTRLRLLATTTSIAALLVLGACSKAGNDDAAPAASDSAMADDATAMSTSPAMAAPMATPSDAQSFTDAMAASDMFEIESSKLAATMSQNAAVKKFAQMMIADHTKSSAELKSLAAKASPAVTVVPAMTDAQRGDLDHLKAATADFDKLYAAKQVAAHQQALSMLRGYAAIGDDAAMKAFASKTATVVSGHLDQARNLVK